MQQSIYATCGISKHADVVETQNGFAVVDRSGKPGAPHVLLIAYQGHREFARLAGGALITEDGEAIEGEGLDDVEVIGVVTHIINRAGFDDLPVM
ncbi:hypothetical protein [Scandinavium sp.]|uniref:hypothetical protein n=1 Tax=Scandinavium sp. TaxID=2830653 RepID=UPI002896E59E|nr:hypothetical protein [Scandinavium sp.]